MFCSPHQRRRAFANLFLLSFSLLSSRLARCKVDSSLLRRSLLLNSSIVLRFAGRRCAPVRRLADKQRAGDHKSQNIREAVNVICQAARCRQALCCGFMDSQNIINVEGAKRRDVVWQIWSLRWVLMPSVMIVSAPSTFSDTCAAKCHASVRRGLRKN